MRAIGTGLELGMKLSGDHTGMIREFDDLDEFSVGRGPRDDETIVLECVTIGIIEFISVSVSFGYLGGPVRLLGECSFFDRTWIGSETHRPSFGTDGLLIFHEVDYLVFGFVVEFFGVSTSKSAHISGEFDRHNL